MRVRKVEVAEEAFFWYYTSMSNQTFALITDFGFDFSVASMKGLILKNFPKAQIIDIDHSIKQFSVLSGAFVIEKIYKYFPQRNNFYMCC